MSTAFGGGAYAPPRKVNFDWIGESWRLFTANAGVWILAVFVATLIPVLIGGSIGAVIGFSGGLPRPETPGSPFPSFSVGTLTGGLPPSLSIGLRVFNIVWTAFFYGGVYRMAVKQVSGEAISAGDIVSGGPLFGRMLVFNIVYGLLMLIGGIFCILPAFIVMGLFLPGPALIAHGAGVSDAFSRSLDGMKGDWLTAAGLAFVVFLLILVSVIPCGLGLLVTIPMYWLISALAYRDMVGMPNLPPPGGETYGYSEPAPPHGVWPPPPSV